MGPPEPHPRRRSRPRETNSLRSTPTGEQQTHAAPRWGTTGCPPRQRASPASPAGWAPRAFLRFAIPPQAAGHPHALHVRRSVPAEIRRGREGLRNTRSVTSDGRTHRATRRAEKSGLSRYLASTTPCGRTSAPQPLPLTNPAPYAWLTEPGALRPPLPTPASAVKQRLWEARGLGCRGRSVMPLASSREPHTHLSPPPDWGGGFARFRRARARILPARAGSSAPLSPIRSEVGIEPQADWWRTGWWVWGLKNDVGGPLAKVCAVRGPAAEHRAPCAVPPPRNSKGSNSLGKMSTSPCEVDI